MIYSTPCCFESTNLKKWDLAVLIFIGEDILVFPLARVRFLGFSLSYIDRSCLRVWKFFQISAFEFHFTFAYSQFQSPFAYDRMRSIRMRMQTTNQVLFIIDRGLKSTRADTPSVFLVRIKSSSSRRCILSQKKIDRKKEKTSHKRGHSSRKSLKKFFLPSTTCLGW